MGLAEGGCGTIITGCAVVSPDTVAFDRVMRIDNDRFIPGLKRLFGDLPHVDIAAELKKYASVPVCAVGSVFTLEAAEAIVASGKADFVAMGRAQMADPAIVRKSAEGRDAEIIKCLECNKCTFWTTGDPEVYCSINPDYRNNN